jgi:hypothetical protein
MRHTQRALSSGSKKLKPNPIELLDRVLLPKFCFTNFADKKSLAEQLQAYINQWNAIAHPFNWTSQSVAKVIAKCETLQSNLAITS